MVVDGGIEILCLFFFIGSFFFQCVCLCVCVKNCGNTRHNNFQFSTHSEKCQPIIKKHIQLKKKNFIYHK